VNKKEGIDGRKYFYLQVAKHLQSYYPVGNPDDREDKSCGPVAAAAQQMPVTRSTPFNRIHYKDVDKFLPSFHPIPFSNQITTEVLRLSFSATFG
jgi:hypothetical protein